MNSWSFSGLTGSVMVYLPDGGVLEVKTNVPSFCVLMAVKYLVNLSNRGGGFRNAVNLRRVYETGVILIFFCLCIVNLLDVQIICKLQDIEVI